MECVLLKSQMKEEVMYLRENEGTSLGSLPQSASGTLTRGAGPWNFLGLGVSWGSLSGRDLSEGAQQRVRMG